MFINVNNKKTNYTDVYKRKQQENKTMTQSFVKALTNC